MVDQTEPQDLTELDRFCEAMESITEEVALIADGH